MNGANDIYKLNKALIEGEMPETENSVIVGKNIFEEAEYSVGDTINITVPQIGQKEVKIVGVFDLKVAAINNSWFVTNIASAQSLFEKEGKASSIEMQIEDVFNSNVVATKVNSLLSEGFTVTDWQAQNEELLSGLSGQSISSIMIQVFVIISVVLAIASVLAISVMQKSKQIGILKAMGIKDKSSSVIFLTQGFILGLMGAIVGIALGIGLIVAFTTFALNPDGTPLIPMTLNIGFIALSGGIAVVASMAASLIPAFRSMRMDPIEVIKNG